MGSYTIVGTAFVRRFLNEEVLGPGKYDTEVLSINTSCSLPDYPESDEDFITTIVNDWEEVPNEEGVWAVQYAATMYWTQDYWGEYDVEADVHWKNIVKVPDERAMWLLEPEEEDSYVQLT